MPNNDAEATIGILLLSADTHCQKQIDLFLESSFLRCDLLAVDSLKECLGVLQEAVFDVLLLDASLVPEEIPESLLSVSSSAVILLIGDVEGQAGLPQRVQDRLHLDSLNGDLLARSIRNALDRTAWISAEQSASARCTSSPFGSSIYRGAFNAFEEPLLVLDRSQQIILLNSAASELLETGPNSLLGEVFPFDARAGTDLIIEIPSSEGPACRMELQAVNFTDSGEPRILVVLRDISRRMEQEDSVTQERKHAEQLPGTDECFREEALQPISQLAGGIAHDLNNILTAVLGNLSIIRMSLGPEHAEAEKLLAAEKAALQAQDLTHQFLTFSKGAAREMQATTLGQLVRDNVQFILRGSNVRFDFSTEPDLWTVDTDKGQISQVINNLAINADQAMPSGGVLTLRLENRELINGQVQDLEPGCYVCLTASDTGVGIPPNVLTHIFDPYFTTKESGNGLGLASCLSIVQRHGGTITVDSEEGAGTTFHVYLPKSETPAEEKRFDQVVAEEDESLPKGSGRILVMDDMEPMKRVAGEILTVLGYDVCLTGDGAEAIRTYREAMENGEPFRAAVLDLTVPGGMGGEETCRRLREYDSGLVAVASSGYSTSSVMSDWESYGFNAVVAKPYRIKDMGRVLHRLLSD